MRALLADRRFRLFFLAQCASLLGDSIFLVAIAFAVLEVTGSAAALGTVLGVGAAALVATLLVSGVWADRLPRRSVMITSDLVRLVTQGALALLLATDRATLLSLVLLYVVFNAATAFFQPARTGLVPQLLESRALVRGNGLLASAQNSIQIAGWAAGGLLVAAVGPASAIALDSISFALSAALLVAMGSVPSTVLEPRRAFLRELGEGWREVTSRRWLWVVVLNASLWLMVFEAPMSVVGPITMTDHYAGASSWGLLGATLAAGAVFGAVLTSLGKLRHPFRASLWLFLVTVASPVLLLVEAPFALLLAVNFLVGLSFGMFDTVWTSVMQHEVPADRLARVSAWDWMGSLAMMPIGYGLAGVAVEHVGMDPTLITMSAATLVVCIALLVDPQVRRLDERMPARAE